MNPLHSYSHSHSHSHLHPHYEIYSSSIDSIPPFTQYIQDTFWEIVEDNYEDALLSNEMLLVSYYTITHADQLHRVEFQSKKLDCHYTDRPCWQRYVIHRLEDEPSPVPWMINGTQ